MTLQASAVLAINLEYLGLNLTDYLTLKPEADRLELNLFIRSLM